MNPTVALALYGALLSTALACWTVYTWLTIRRKDAEAAEERFQAAVLIVLDELGANEVNIEHMIHERIGHLEVYDATYRSGEVVLATRLKPEHRQLLAEAYAPTRSQWVAEDQTVTPADRMGLRAGGMSAFDVGPLTAALEKIRAARSALASYVPASATNPTRAPASHPRKKET
jgi:hypothetical protein